MHDVKGEQSRRSHEISVAVAFVCPETVIDTKEKASSRDIVFLTCKAPPHTGDDDEGQQRVQ